MFELLVVSTARKPARGSDVVGGVVHLHREQRRSSKKTYWKRCLALGTHKIHSRDCGGDQVFDHALSFDPPAHTGTDAPPVDTFLLLSQRATLGWAVIPVERPPWQAAVGGEMCDHERTNTCEKPQPSESSSNDTIEILGRMTTAPRAVLLSGSKRRG